MSAEITTEQARQTIIAADDSYEKIRWMVVSSPALREELRSLALTSFIAGLRQGDLCGKGEK